MKCAHCQAELQPGMKFCTNCGARVEAAASPASPQSAGQVTCPNCRASLAPGMKFCTHCGTAIAGSGTQATFTDAGSGTSISSTPVTQSSATPADSRPTIPVRPISTTVPTSTSAAPAATASKRPFATPTIIIAAAIAVVVVAAAAFGAWWFLLRGNGGNRQPLPQASVSLQNSGTSDSSGSSDSDESSKSSKKAVICTDLPKMTVMDVDGGTSLGISVKFTSACTDEGSGIEDKFDEDDVQITARDDGAVIASAVFDFSDNPLDLSNGSETRTLMFASGQFWRSFSEFTASDVTLEATEDVEPSGSQAAGVGGSTIAGLPIDRDEANHYAHEALTWQIKHDESDAQQFLTTYTTQLSSKKNGMEADGKTWDYVDIVQQFIEQKVKNPNALLVWSGNWPTYTKTSSSSDYYVILSGEKFDSADSASDWCPAHGYAPADCIAVDLQ